MTPKPRLISLGSQKYESDDESDEEDVSEIRKPVTATKDVDSAGTSTKPFALPFSIRRFLLSMFLWVFVCSGGLLGYGTMNRNMLLDTVDKRLINQHSSIMIMNT